MKWCPLQRDRGGEEAIHSKAIRSLEVAADVRTLLIENLQSQIAVLRRAMYGRKSEKMEQEVGQLELKLEEVLLD